MQFSTIVFQDPKTSSARYARLQICTSFVRLAKSAEKSLLPHMKVVLHFLLIDFANNSTDYSSSIPIN